MAFQALLTALALPPLLLELVVLGGLALAWTGRKRLGLTTAAVAAVLQILLATPVAAGLLVASLEREVELTEAASRPPPAAIVVLGAEAVRDLATGSDVGPLTLERLRAAASLHRRTGLPVLVTAGPVGPGGQPLAALMAWSLEADFGVSVRWQEGSARDTWENAAFATAMLRDAGIASAYVVTHAWHMPRALAAFGRRGLAVTPAPVRMDGVPTGAAAGWMPRADHLAQSWFALREWAGRLVYALRG